MADRIDINNVEIKNHPLTVREIYLLLLTTSGGADAIEAMVELFTLRTSLTAKEAWNLPMEDSQTLSLRLRDGIPDIADKSQNFVIFPLDNSKTIN